MIENTCAENDVVISVVVPVYNIELYLKRCVNSILEQSCTNIEIILVDDGSTDKSGQICDYYQKLHPNVKVIHEKNKGSGRARIVGLQKAKGKYVGFIDGDDWIEKDMYLFLLEAAIKNNSDISIGGYVYDKAGFTERVFSVQEPRIMNGRNATKEMFLGEFFNWSLCDKLYRREFLCESILKLEIPFSYGEDTLINWKCFRNARTVSYTPLEKYHYNVHESSMTHKSLSLDKIRYLDIYETIIEDLRTNNEEELLEIVVGVMASVCLSAIYDLLPLYEENIELFKKQLSIIDSYINLVKGNDSIYKSRETKILSEYLHRNFLDLICDQIKRKEIVECCAGTEYFIYGAGKIAEEALAALREADSTPKAIVVSSKDKRKALYGIPIITVEDCLRKKGGKLFVLALNRRNYNQVKDSIGSYEEIKIINFGCYSAFY